MYFTMCGTPPSPQSTWFAKHRQRTPAVGVLLLEWYGHHHMHNTHRAPCTVHRQYVADTTATALVESLALVRTTVRAANATLVVAVHLPTDRLARLSEEHTRMLLSATGVDSKYATTVAARVGLPTYIQNGTETPIQHTPHTQHYPTHMLYRSLVTLPHAVSEGSLSVLHTTVHDAAIAHFHQAASRQLDRLGARKQHAAACAKALFKVGVHWVCLSQGSQHCKPIIYLYLYLFVLFLSRFAYFCKRACVCFLCVLSAHALPHNTSTHSCADTRVLHRLVRMRNFALTGQRPLGSMSWHTSSCSAQQWRSTPAKPHCSVFLRCWQSLKC